MKKLSRPARLPKAPPRSETEEGDHYKVHTAQVSSRPATGNRKPGLAETAKFIEKALDGDRGASSVLAHRFDMKESSLAEQFEHELMRLIMAQPQRVMARIGKERVTHPKTGQIDLFLKVRTTLGATLEQNQYLFDIVHELIDEAKNKVLKQADSA